MTSIRFSLAVCCCFAALYSSPNRLVQAHDKYNSKYSTNAEDFDKCEHQNGLSPPPLSTTFIDQHAAPNDIDNSPLLAAPNVRPYENRQESEAVLSSKTVQRLFNISPPMVLLNSSNDLCKKHSQMYLKEFEKLTIWALNMYDSSAKISSGILNGNVNQFGDFDMCLKANDPNLGIRGQYCLTFLEMSLPSNANPKLKYIFDQIHSHSAIRSRLEDVGHIIPKFSSINWAVCTPASCTPADVEQELYAVLSRHVNATEISLRLKVDPNMCQTYQPSFVPTTGFLIAATTFGILFATIIVSTMMHQYNMFFSSESSNLLKILYSFSLKRNIRQLFNVNESPEDIMTIHGVRTLSAIMVFMIHKTMVMCFNPISNRTVIVEQTSKPWSGVLRTSLLYTDTFLLMSGLLTTISFLKHLDRKGKIDLPKEILSRYFRLMPAIGACILFCTLILPNLDSGPQWNLVIKTPADICKKNWWRNLLFIHNYFGAENMCIAHTHHMGIDFQLFMVSPLLVFSLWKWPRRSVIGLLVLASVSTGLRYYVTLTRKLNYFFHFGISITSLRDFCDYSYSLPTHRLTVYIMGILLAYCLRYFGRNHQMKNIYLRFGWVIAFGCLCVVLIWPSKMSVISYVYNASDSANYATIAPIFFCIFFGWIIFVSHTGNGGFISSLFSWKGFIVCARLSYSFYLVHFPIFYYKVGINRSALEYTGGLLVDINEFIVVVLISALLTVAVEMPFNNIKSVLIRQSSRPQDAKERLD